MDRRIDGWRQRVMDWALRVALCCRHKYIFCALLGYRVVDGGCQRSHLLIVCWRADASLSAREMLLLTVHSENMYQNGQLQCMRKQMDGL